MMEHVLETTNRPLNGKIKIPGDKSISHRAVIFGSLAEGTTVITNFLEGEDCMRTVDAFRSMGVQIEKKEGGTVTIQSGGIPSLKEPVQPLYFGNSGTTTRLMLGLLAGLPFFTSIHGDQSLTSRPMDRAVNPLREMGASIDGREYGKYLPLSVRGQQLKGIDYTLPVKSAQVKSAVILAGLLAEGRTVVREEVPTRNHTENMLQAFGGDLKTDGSRIEVSGASVLKGTDVEVPGDISSAAFFLAAAAIVPDSEVTLESVGLNPSRTGMLDVMKNMGCNLEITNERKIGGEELGDITVRYTPMKGVTIGGELIPKLIDEIPVIALMATQAEGTTVIKDAEELRVKETDRIAAVTDVLTSLGADITATADGMIIKGRTKLEGASVASYDDHRIAMMAAISSLVAKGSVKIDDISCIAISYPNFFGHLNELLP